MLVPLFACRGENEFIHMAIELETMNGCEKGSPWISGRVLWRKKSQVSLVVVRIIPICKPLIEAIWKGYPQPYFLDLLTIMVISIKWLVKRVKETSYN